MVLFILGVVSESMIDGCANVEDVQKPRNNLPRSDTSSGSTGTGW